MLCDLIARMAFAPLELNISTVTSVFGAPIVIFMMLKRQRRKALMEEYYLQLENLEVGYDGTPLIHDINIGIREGGDCDPDRPQRLRKIHDLKEYYQAAEA